MISTLATLYTVGLLVVDAINVLGGEPLADVVARDGLMPIVLHFGITLASVGPTFRALSARRREPDQPGYALAALALIGGSLVLLVIAAAAGLVLRSIV
ncbi:hypothetical protein F8O01_10300 [Pseudoclavibacter chungangensis]|uniref:Uncharacterized protein n=1 Tax=Pseudoclavibacter chungangensis TaxID=587635 RepID=A0A7J5BRX6_9MICO|nr:hypothetical protein [Pseudoclavibacter chungangensis]KAB1656759.1 hypothetical protein F8O01_10300 [Pseudoclavibacter chungangensis]NYJ67778.1 hypothetical protein [Pseudoclavibacter chungangensis]